MGGEGVGCGLGVAGWGLRVASDGRPVCQPVTGNSQLAP
jgi:hypothetical protein